MSQTTPHVRCQAITRSERQCRNRARSHTAYCRVHAGRVGQAAPIDTEFLPLLALHSDMAGFKAAETLSHERMARSRVGVLMWVGFGTWLLGHLLSAGSTYALGGSPAGWIVTGFAFVLSCGVLGRLAAGMSVVRSLGFVGLNLLSVALDSLHKEGLILNLCYVVIPVLLPLWGLTRLELAWAWGFFVLSCGDGRGMAGLYVSGCNVALIRHTATGVSAEWTDMMRRWGLNRPRLAVDMHEVGMV